MKLLTLSNYIPEQIANVTRFIDYDGMFKMSHCCNYIQNFISYAEENDNFDGVIFPNSCDGARSAIDYMGKSKKFIYQLKHPTIVTRASCEYFAKVLEDYKISLEQHCGNSILLDDILEKTSMLEARGKYLHNIYESSAISDYADYIEQINTMLQNPLADWEKYAPKANKACSQRKNVYIVGAFMGRTSLLTQIEQCGLQIAGDNLTNSKRLMWSEYKFNKSTIFEDIAYHILQNQASPTIDRFTAIWEKDIAEIKKKNIRGVIFICPKFCEPYEYLYTLYCQRLNDMGIPSLRIYIDDSFEGASPSVEAFAEII